MNLITPSQSIPATHTHIIQENVALADKNWFRTGGNARYYAQPTSIYEFQLALDFARAHELQIFVLGEGANILVSDEGFDGLVIHPALKTIEHTDLDEEHALVTAGAGVSFAELITWCIDNNIIGLEEFSGIPGTVGGSVFINIHYFEFLLSNFLEHAIVIDKGTGLTAHADNSWFEFGYNTSKLHEDRYYLASATFKLKKVDPITAAFARGRSIEITRHRVKRYPYAGTCGSFFRNFHDHEVSLMSAGKKLIFVAYYLDKLGIKGQLSVGDAIISYQHANMLVNKGNATTADIIELARKMQQLVFDNFGILPQPECRLIGFTTYPLLQ